MTDGENFLERWSRRKIETDREPLPATPPSAARPVADAASPAEAAARPEQPVAQPKPEFDIATLPSIESIAAATDVRAFLAPGVPPELARAALRRAWAADPAIRDFKGLADYDWDFTDPNAMPGFGELPAGTDIKSMVAQVFGQAEKLAEAPTGTNEPNTQPEPALLAAESDLRPTTGATTGAPLPTDMGLDAATQGTLVQRVNIAASHNSNPANAPEQPKTRRSHGRALPQ